MKRVVITGLGAVSPIGNTVKEFWDNAKKGKCGIDFITRFDTTDFKVKLAAEVKEFAPTLYMDKSRLRRTDLFTQYALAASTQAVEDSGLVAKAVDDGEAVNIDPEKFGVYLSSGIGGITTFYDNCIGLHTTGPRGVSPFFIASMIENIAAGEVAIKFNAQGLSLTTVTACASATNSIGEAFHAIKVGKATAIIAGGAEACVTPLVVAGFTNCMAMSTKNEPNDTSVPFDKRRNGFVVGEGGGAIILEEYNHALKRGAKIYAEIVGYGNTCDAFHVTAPVEGGKGAARAIKIALKEGKLNGENLYINAHGTSTPLNDKAETQAIKTALGDKKAKAALVSSTKSMIGHCLGAAGALEAIASIMALKEGIVPPTINYKEVDIDCDLDYVPNKARKAPHITSAISNNMGFGGHNACIAFKKYNAN